MKGHQYTHLLTIDKATKGINIAISNSISLLSDAQLLYSNNRYERAASLAILAIEEIGKTSIIREIVLYDNVHEIKESWKRYRRHTSKNVMWLLPQWMNKGAKKLDEYGSMFNDREGTQLLDNIKQLSFYTDCYGKCHWNAPSDVIDEPLAKSLIELATLLVQPSKKRMVSTKEIEVWVKHMKPAIKLTHHSAKAALVNCFSELEHLGISEEGDSERMNAFAFGEGITIPEPSKQS